MASAFEFIQQVRAEAAKVVWPNRQEVTYTTIVVIALSFLASLFFLLTDWAISHAVLFTLSFGH